jgi:hypothetical protein
MNPVRHLEMLQRHKRILAGGVVLGILLAVLALYKPTLSGGVKLEARTPSVYAAESKIIVTQEGFPWGRGALPGVNSDLVDENGQPIESEDQTRFVDPGRFAYLAWIYSHFLTGDEVRKMLPHHPPGRGILAQPVMAGGGMSADALPMIQLRTSAASAGDAQRLNAEAVEALETYIKSNQDSGQVPKGERVELQIVNRSFGAALVEGKPYSLALAAFVLALVCALALAWLLEKLRASREWDTAELIVAEQFGGTRESRLEQTAG